MSRILTSGAFALLVFLAAVESCRAANANSPDGKVLAQSNDKAIGIFDAQSGRELRRILAHTKTVSALAFSPDGKALASGDEGGTVCRIDMATGKLLWKYSGGALKVATLTFSNDGRKLVATLANNTKTELDAATGKKLP
jgi:WD40 repeat protein